MQHDGDADEITPQTRPPLPPPMLRANSSSTSLSSCDGQAHTHTGAGTQPSSSAASPAHAHAPAHPPALLTLPPSPHTSIPTVPVGSSGSPLSSTSSMASTPASTRSDATQQQTPLQQAVSETPTGASVANPSPLSPDSASTSVSPASAAGALYVLRSPDVREVTSEGLVHASALHGHSAALSSVSGPAIEPLLAPLLSNEELEAGPRLLPTAVPRGSIEEAPASSSFAGKIKRNSQIVSQDQHPLAASFPSASASAEASTAAAADSAPTTTAAHHPVVIVSPVEGSIAPPTAVEASTSSASSSSSSLLLPPSTAASLPGSESTTAASTAPSSTVPSPYTSLPATPTHAKPNPTAATAPSTPSPSPPQQPPQSSASNPRPERVLEFIALFSYDRSQFVHTGSGRGSGAATDNKPDSSPSGFDFISGTGLKGRLEYRVPSSASRPKNDDLPEALEHFVYPQGLRLETDPTPPLLHSFVLTMVNGSRMYAYVYTKWLPVPDHVLTVVKMQVANTLIDSPDPNPHHLPSALWGPHSLVIISAFPFYDSLATMLKLVATKFFMSHVPAGCPHSGAAAQQPPPEFHPSLPQSTQLIDSLYAVFGDVAPLRCALHETERTLGELYPVALEFRDAVTRMCAKTGGSAEAKQLTAGASNKRRASQGGDADDNDDDESSELDGYSSDDRDDDSSMRPQWLDPLHEPVSPVPELFLQQLTTCCRLCLTHLPFLLPAPPLFDNLPLLEPSNLGALFDSLSLKHVLQVWNAVLCELPCLFVSADIQRLTPALESLSALLYPMKWPYVYIPVLPIFLTDVLDAPQPFLIGAGREVLQSLPETITSGETNIVIVDLDRDAVCMSGNLQATLRRESKARSRAKWAIMGVTPSAEAFAAASETSADQNPFPDPFLVHGKIVSMLLANQGLAPGEGSLAGFNPVASLSQSMMENFALSPASMSLRDLNPFVHLHSMLGAGSSSARTGGSSHGHHFAGSAMATLSSDPSALTASGSVPLSDDSLEGAELAELAAAGMHSSGAHDQDSGDAHRHQFLPWNLLWRLFDGVGAVLNPLRLAQQEAARDKQIQIERDQALADKYSAANTPEANAKRAAIARARRRNPLQRQEDLSHYGCGASHLAALPPNLPTHAWPVFLPGLVRELKASIQAQPSQSISEGWSFLGLGSAASAAAAAAAKGTALIDADSPDESLWSPLSYLGSEAFFLARFQALIEKAKRPVLLLSTARFLYSGTDVSSSEGELMENEQQQAQAQSHPAHGHHQHHLHHTRAQSHLALDESKHTSAAASPSHSAGGSSKPEPSRAPSLHHMMSSPESSMHSSNAAAESNSAHPGLARPSSGLAAPPHTGRSSSMLVTSSSGAIAERIGLAPGSAHLTPLSSDDEERDADEERSKNDSSSKGGIGGGGGESARSGQESPFTVVAAEDSDSARTSFALTVTPATAGAGPPLPAKHRASEPSLGFSGVALSPFRQKQAGLTHLSPPNLGASAGSNPAGESDEGTPITPATPAVFGSGSAAGSGSSPHSRARSGSIEGVAAGGSSTSLSEEASLSVSVISPAATTVLEDPVPSSLVSEPASDPSSIMDDPSSFDPTAGGVMRTRERSSFTAGAMPVPLSLLGTAGGAGGKPTVDRQLSSIQDGPETDTAAAAAAPALESRSSLSPATRRASLTPSPRPQNISASVLPLRELASSDPSKSFWPSLSQAEMLSIRRRFLSVFVSLLHSHRAFTGFQPKPLDDGFGGALNGAGGGQANEDAYEVTFETSAFLKYVHKDYKPFLHLFLETQMFRFFTEERLTRETSVQAAQAAAATATPPATMQPSATGGMTKSGSLNSIAGNAAGGNSSTTLPLSASSPTSAARSDGASNAAAASLTSSAPIPSTAATSSIPPSVSSSSPPNPNASNDWFDRLCRQKRERMRIQMNQWGENGKSSMLFKLGRKVPTWKERYFELNRHGTILRYYAFNAKMIAMEPTFKELKKRCRLTPRDVVAKANLDRLAAQREKLRASLFRGEIKIEPGQTSVHVPNAERKYMTAYVFEVVTPTRSLLACAPDLQTRDEWICIIRARAAKLSIDHQRSLGDGPSLPHLESRLQHQLRVLRQKNIANLTKSFMDNMARKQQRFIAAGGVVTKEEAEATAAATAAASAAAAGAGGNKKSKAMDKSGGGGGGNAPSSVAPGPVPLSLPHALLVCEHLRTSLDLRTFKTLFRSYPHCFSGRDATHYILHQNLCDSLSASVALCNIMITNGLILNVSASNKDAPFKPDQKSMYTFPRNSMLLSGGSHHHHGAGAGGAASSGAGGLNAAASDLEPHGVAHLLPTEEERVIVSRMREELDVRDRVHGLFRHTHKDCFVARDAVAWLLDRGVCSNESAAVRLCTRLVRTAQMLPVSVTGSPSTAALRNLSMENNGELFRFHAAIRAMNSTLSLLDLDDRRESSTHTKARGHAGAGAGAKK